MNELDVFTPVFTDAIWDYGALTLRSAVLPAIKYLRNF
jgi:hypothetical protein